MMTARIHSFPKKGLIGATGLMILLTGGGIWGISEIWNSLQVSSQAQEEEETATVSVETVTVGKEITQRDRVLTGTVEANQSSTLSTRVPGAIQELLVEEGDRVSKGDLIARIDSRDLQAQTNQAQANISQAEASVNAARSAYISAQSQKNQAEARVQEAQGRLREAEAQLADAQLHQRRMKMLYENGAVSESRLDEANTRLATAQARIDQIQANIEQAKSQVEQARSQMEQAQSNIEQSQARVEQASASLQQNFANLDYGEIKAPFNGVVTQEHAQAGEMAGQGQPIITLETVDDLEFRVSIPESLLRQISVGETIPIEIGSIGREIEGKVKQIVPSADPGSRSFTAKISLPPDKQVIPGMFGRLALSTQETGGLMVPQSSVVEQLGLTGVYRVVDNQAQFTTVTLGSEKADQVQVHSGLNPEDTIIVNPSSDIKEGVSVSVN